MDRGLVGFGRRVGEGAGLRLEDDRPLSARCPQRRLDRGPVGADDRFELGKADDPWADREPVIDARDSELFLGEGAVGGHPGERDRDSEMGDDHAPQRQRRALEIAPE